MDQLTWAECESSVRKVFEGSECKLLHYDVQPASVAPIGFFGVHLRIVATVHLNGSEEKRVQLFAKRPPTTSVHSSYVASCGLFRREASIYTSYAPRLKAVMPPGLKLPLADCFFARGEDSRGDLIVMEDLQLGGYKMADKRMPMDLAQCRTVLEALARLHGASILLERTASRPDSLYQKGEFESIEDPVFVLDTSNPSYAWCKASAETFTSVVSSLWPQRFGDESSRSKVYETTWKGWEDIICLVKHSKVYLNVLCHGDTWANNIMFRRGSEDSGDSLEVVLVDFQHHRYAPPALDILLFLHTTTGREFRDSHLEDLLRYYREALSRVVSPELVDQLLPLEELRKSVDELRVFGRLFATSLLSIVLLSDEKDGEGPGEEKQDFMENMVRNRSKDVLLGLAKDEGLKERMMESHQEFLESVGLWE